MTSQTTGLKESTRKRKPVLTAFAVLGMIFIVVGYWLQARAVIRHNSGNALSLTWIVGSLATSATKMLYGHAKVDYIVIAIGLVNLACQAALLSMVWNHKKASKSDKQLGLVLGCLLVLMASVPNEYFGLPHTHLKIGYKDGSLLLVGFVVWLSQSRELSRADKTSVFQEKMPWALIASSLLLGLYMIGNGHVGLIIGYAFFVGGQLGFIWQHRQARNRIKPA